jgi:hypothetical protein
MTSETATLLVGVLFLLIAIVGGGFSAKDVTIPSVPKWARIVSAILGSAFILLFAYSTLSSKVPSLPGGATIIYSNNQPDVTPHNIAFVQLEAKAAHNPPLVNDTITIKFSLKSIGKTPIELDSGTFITVRNPSGQIVFIPRLNANRVIQPNETIETETSADVDSKGSWEVNPCYKLKDESIEGGFCPEGWKGFIVTVQ